MVDLFGFPGSAISLKPAEDRTETLIVAQMNVKYEQTLSPALAGKLYGKLMFVSSQYFARSGRALLRAFLQLVTPSGNLAACRLPYVLSKGNRTHCLAPHYKRRRKHTAGQVQGIRHPACAVHLIE